MSDTTAKQPASPAVLSLAQLLEQQPSVAPACLVEPGLLPPQGILFVGGEPKVGKSLLVANLALSLAAGADRIGFPIPAPRRVLICQFELPVQQFVSRLAIMRRALGAAADQNLLVDTRAMGHLLSAAQGLTHFVCAARAAAAEIIVLDPLYSTHDQDENDTRAMAALCQSLLRLRDASRAASGGGASCPQIHRPLRDWQRLPRLQRSACGRRQLPAAHAAFSPGSHPRASFSVPLCRRATSAPAATRSTDSVVLFHP